MIVRDMVAVIAESITSTTVARRIFLKCSRTRSKSAIAMTSSSSAPATDPAASVPAEKNLVDIVDNYWQTETGWAICATPRGLDESAPPEPEKKKD